MTRTSDDMVNIMNTVDSKFTDYANAYKHYIDSPGCQTNPNNCDELTTFKTKEAEFRNYIQNNLGDVITTHNDQYKDIAANFKSNQQLRQKIDKELLELQDSTALNDSKQSMDMTIFVGICWSIAATGLLYYIIVEM